MPSTDSNRYRLIGELSGEEKPRKGCWTTLDVVVVAEAVRFELTNGCPLPVFKFPVPELYVDLSCYCKPCAPLWVNDLRPLFVLWNLS